ncbi:hypothetical protein LTR56_015123 [Elasticomyces elasticus]|nr:hypothetical protein LTR56_015123 [Elasticomyces elasticus]KAK3651965.1 hypothetical protein LTR22_011895 [Elasticomyces elasticus]KAK4919082.1 hypothetical protein LTR49_013253 [Elasticomyces elasticus]KAK5765686.1 hypothetical protein LTS12_004192 [Elasticomyces elasticus]
MTTHRKKAATASATATGLPTLLLRTSNGPKDSNTEYCIGQLGSRTHSGYVANATVYSVHMLKDFDPAKLQVKQMTMARDMGDPYSVGE